MSPFSTKCCIRSTVLACCIASAAGAAWAGSIEVSPVRVNLSAQVRVAVLRVYNRGDEEALVQVSAYPWMATDPPDGVEPTDQLLLTPTTFRLAPEAAQIVRVGLRADAPAGVEEAYRLVIEEVPLAQTQDSTRMRLVVRHDLPVFVAAQAVARDQLGFAVDCQPQGASLRLRNLGNRHLKVLRMRLTQSATQNTVGDWNKLLYLLPTQETGWDVTAFGADAAQRLHTATVDTEAGTLVADVELACPR
jgi:fimbrial chaperone protein